MIKRTIEISQEPAHLTVRLNQLILQRDGQTVGSVPCEDLGIVISDHPRTTYSHAALATLAESDAVLVVCGRDHLPAAVLLPMSDHSQIVWRVQDQISVGRPRKKQLWKQIVKAKIRAQAENLSPDLPEHRLLLNLARDVRSGDPDNLEAQAARFYWRAWLIGGPSNGAEVFRRDPDGARPNGLLNYGYAVLRAAVARAVVAAGLLPVFGLKHSNRSNAFCLADDLLEPLRPMVDDRVRTLYWEGRDNLDQRTKGELLDLLTREVRTGEQTGPLFVALHRFVASLVRCFRDEQRELEIPVRCR
jgi:CRISPR-associated protein Cas1